MAIKLGANFTRLAGDLVWARLVFQWESPESKMLIHMGMGRIQMLQQDMLKKLLPKEGPILA